MAGYGGIQLIRLLRSLILTRLLFPEAFGVMALVWTLMFALEMFSDLGLPAFVIRDKRGDDPAFLNTVWTLQAIRGVALWVACVLIAHPMALFYQEPMLSKLVPIAGLSAVLSGLNSTALYTLRRRMEFRRLTALELANEIVSFLAVVLWRS